MDVQIDIVLDELNLFSRVKYNWVNLLVQLNIIGYWDMEFFD